MKRPKPQRTSEKLGGKRKYWQRLHDRGIFAPNYHPNSPDLLWAREKLRQTAQEGFHKILDIGASKGFLTKEISHPNAKIFSLEPTQVKMESHRAKQHYVQGIGERIPLEANSVDAVLCAYTLEYSAKDSMTGEIKRVLKPGGRVIALLHNPRSGYMEVLKRDQSNAKKLEQLFQNILNNKFRTQGQLERAVRRSGFSQSIRQTVEDMAQTLHSINLRNPSEAKDKARQVMEEFWSYARHFVALPQNIFQSEEAIRKYFSGNGFSVDLLKTITHLDKPVCYAVILTKP